METLTKTCKYTEITSPIRWFDFLAIVRHFGSFGMSCHNRSHELAIKPRYALFRTV
ncbi:TPA_asm: hypothetical protein G3V02_003435 [Salmonella enterica subsp. enterica serovar Ank]|uniref:Uncharacterized protein n=1 Tax=Salmonella enterica subsp. enterica serovar Ank TaxID=1173578 RepID=A0A726YYZ8_SALET|nr:hypothetical protein [Salmonella enterica subsp. enterica serovar Ank]